MISVLSELSIDHKVNQSNLLCKKLFQLPLFVEAQKIAFYWSMSLEVQTQLLIQTAQSMNKQLFLPKCVGSDMIMLPFNQNNLQLNKMGFYEPICTDVVDGGNMDLVIVPGNF